MKSIFSLLILSLLIVTHQAGAQSTPSVVTTSFSKIYIPDAFDTNDNVQIVGEGYFPNSCYRYATTSVKVDHENKKITLTPTAYKYNGICLMVILPFDRVLDLGILKEGQYTIVQGDVNRQVGQISIHTAATSDADDYMYAPITQGFYNARSAKVYLTGNFPLSCMKLKEIKTHLQADVFVIQPIVELDKSLPCTDGEFPFETSVSAESLPKGRYLMHVRSMNGKSVNSLFDVR